LGPARFGMRGPSFPMQRALSLGLQGTQHRSSRPPAPAW
jgi:hypothetical protein